MSKSAFRREFDRVWDESISAFIADQAPFEARSCRKCGCTDDHACPGGCYWVEADLCSRCATKAQKKSSVKL